MQPFFISLKKFTKSFFVSLVKALSVVLIILISMGALVIIPIHLQKANSEDLLNNLYDLKI